MKTNFQSTGTFPSAEQYEDSNILKDKFLILLFLQNSEMANRGPLGFWALLSTFDNKFFDLSTSSMRKVDIGMPTACAKIWQEVLSPPSSKLNI